MPKINVYLPDELAEAVKYAQIPVSAICQAALERAVREVASARGFDMVPEEDEPVFGVMARFTPRARQALTLAEQAARAIPHNYVGTEHLLLGMLEEGTNLGIKVLQALDVEVDNLRAELVGSLGKPTKPAKEQPTFTPLAKSVLEEMAKEALALGHNYIGCEHLLLAVLAVEDGVASQVLRRMGVELRTTRRTVVAALTGFVHAKEPPAPPPADSVVDQILQRLDAIESRLPA
jgi:ATP-dependent Clp protease ATP-binding subunit ClpA